MPRDAPPRSHESGQAGSEYVGLLTLVAVVVAVAATAAGAAAVPSVAAEVVKAMRHGICVVGGGVCTAREAQAAGLDPCVIHVRSDGERVGAVIALVRVGRGDTAIVERRSDGTASISFLDDNRLGTQAGIGLQLPGVGATATITAGAGLAFNTGHSYDFASWAAARRFLARHAGQETTAGEGRNLVRRLSPLHEPRELPEASTISFEAGTWTDLEAELAGSVPRTRVDVTGTADIRLAALLGRRRAGARDTWYLRLDEAASARLGLVVAALGGGARGEAVLEVTTNAGALESATITQTSGVSGELRLHGQTSDLSRLAARLGEASGGTMRSALSGRTMEVRTTLDLTVPENRGALAGALDVLRLRAAPSDWARRVDELGARLDSDARVDVAVYRSAARDSEQSARLALGLQLGVEHFRSQETRELIAAWTAQGSALREREDCLPPEAGASALPALRPAALGDSLIRPWPDPSRTSLPPSRRGSRHTSPT